jgi:golgi to ER traffic protein 4
MPPSANTKLPTPERALSAILPLIETAPYEAHQKARTFASRYVKSASTSATPAAYYDTTIAILFQSSCALLKIGQTGSGVDLLSFLIDVYELKGEEITDESRGRLTQIIALTGEKGVWRKGVIDKCVAWTAKKGVYPAGDPALHYYVGDLLYKGNMCFQKSPPSNAHRGIIIEGQYAHALPHFLNSGTRDSARSLAEMFIAWLPSAPNPAYQGVFALHGVLPYVLILFYPASH